MKRERNFGGLPINEETYKVAGVGIVGMIVMCAMLFLSAIIG